MKERLNEPIDVIEQKINNLSPALLNILIKDNSTKQNLRWGTFSYEKYGKMYLAQNIMLPETLIGPNINLLTPRVSKTQEEQQARTNDKGEVFTPAWMCNMQINYIDEDWFGKKSVFNKEIDKGWKTVKKRIVFPKKKKKTWQDYVSDVRIEITCGEAPYLVSRYDVVKGEIIPIENRIGVLDRKLRVINENVNKEDEWLIQAQEAYKSTYGYDFQGDNVLIARENLLYTLIDNMVFKFGHQPNTQIMKQFAKIISWNIWQMDGIDYTVPYSEQEVENVQIQLNLFEEEPKNVEKVKCLAKIKDWKSNRIISFKEVVEGKNTTNSISHKRKGKK